MTVYKLQISDRKDAKFTIVDAYTLMDIPIPVGFNPFEHKMFNQDIFTFKEGIVGILHSVAKCIESIPGVLVLENPQTYGRIKDKFLYKCVPDDKSLPIFLIPYKLRLGFNKSLKNKYVVFEFRQWENKHPVGSLLQTIGDVSVLFHFYEYQLYCKGLDTSIKNMNSKTMKKLKEKTTDEYIEMIIEANNLQDYRETRNIFSIDPENSKDFDDAFDIENIDGGYRISIYIANVSLWMDVLDLWDSFSNRVSTIYLPDRKRTMLPVVLSDSLCSLTQNYTRFALELQLTIKDNDIVYYNFYNCVIKVKKNLRYDTEDQENYADYKKLFGIVTQMNKINKYSESIDNSHDVVQYLMINMNYLSAKELINLESGVFRGAKFNDTTVSTEEMPSGVKKFLKNWNSSGGKYSKKFGDHDMLQLDAYVHITSPIRRLVDLLNIMTLQDKLGLLVMSDKARTFYERWTSDSSIEYINTKMSSSRRVQNDCNLLEMCMNDSDILDNVYDGYIFDKLQRDEKNQYTIYLPKLNMVNRFTSRHIKKNFTKQKFKIFVFTDQYSLKRKIRVEMQ
jgi:exoribonuclease R